MSDYATFQQVARFLQGAEEADTEAVQDAIAAASRMIDRLCEVNDEFFAKAETAASAKIFRGTGTALLRLAPYVPGSLTALTGYDLMNFRERGAPPLQYLLAPAGGYFSEDTRYEATARWGFAAVPAEIQQATVALAIKIFRESDPATVRMSDTENQLTQSVPPFVRSITDAYKKMNLYFAEI